MLNHFHFFQKYLIDDFMRWLILVAIFVSWNSLSVIAQTFAFDWAGKTGGWNTDYAYGITTDNNNNVYAIGDFKGTVDLNPCPGVYNVTSVGQADSYIQKFDQEGNFLWVKTFGSVEYDFVKGITIDAAGNILLTGWFYLTCDFDPGPGVFNLTSSDAADGFIMKLDGDGNFIWAKALSGLGNCFAEEITCDVSGNMYITGSFNSTTDFDPSVGNSEHTSLGMKDAFVAKYTSDGDFLWAQHVGGVDDEIGKDIQMDVFQNVFVCGSIRSNSVDFDTGAGSLLISTNGNKDVFLWKLDSNGDLITAFGVGGTSDDEVNALLIDDLGSCYLVGVYAGTTDFDASIGVDNLTSNGSGDAFLLKADNNLNHLWAKSIGGTAGDRAQDIKINSNGEIIVLGVFNNTIDIDPGSSIYNITAGLGHSVFLIQLDSDANFIWGCAVGSNGYLDPEELAIDSENALVITGNFDGTGDFNSGIGIYNLTAMGIGEDNFVLRMQVCNPTGSSESISVCDSYMWSNTGATYTTSDAYTDTLIAVSGCDSLVTLNLTVHSSFLNVESVVSCYEYLWPVTGLTYASSTSEVVYLTSINGCDSTLNLELVIADSSSTTQVVTACDSYTWIDGNTYSSSNNSATHVLASSQGCDSTVTLNLTISDSPSATVLQNGFILTSTNSGVTYQWIDCDNSNGIIPGETNQEFNPISDGNYALVVTDGICSDTSICFNINGLGIPNQDQLFIKVYPNPSNSKFDVLLDASFDIVNYKIMNSIGEVILDRISEENNFVLDLTNHAPGIYYLQFILDETTYNIPLILE